MSALTPKKKKFTDAFWKSCRVPGDLSTGDHEAAARVAGYKHPKIVGYKFISASGEVKDDAVEMRLRELYAELRETTSGRAEVVQYSSDIDMDDADIAALRRIRDDELAPHGARVRAAELLMKQKGIDKPKNDDVQEEPEKALEAMLVLLGVEEVDPVNFTMGQATSWTLPAPKSSTATSETTSTRG